MMRTVMIIIVKYVKYSYKYVLYYALRCPDLA